MQKCVGFLKSTFAYFLSHHQHFFKAFCIKDLNCLYCKIRKYKHKKAKPHIIILDQWLSTIGGPCPTIGQLNWDPSLRSQCGGDPGACPLTCVVEGAFCRVGEVYSPLRGTP